MRRILASLVALLLLVSLCAPTAMASLAALSHSCCPPKPAQHHHCGTPATRDVAVRDAALNCCPHCATTVAARPPAAAARLLRVGAPADPHPFLTEFAPAFAAAPDSPADQGRAPPTAPPAR